jgi:hypothetical protein
MTLRDALEGMIEHVCDNECSEHGCSAIKFAQEVLAADAARAPVGLEAELRQWIADRRDSQTATTFGVVADLMEALLNSTLPLDPADRAWDAATGVVERGTPPRDPHERDCDICGKPMTDVDYFASVIRCPTCESTLVVPVAETPPAYATMPIRTDPSMRPDEWRIENPEPGRARETAPATQAEKEKDESRVDGQR